MYLDTMEVELLGKILKNELRRKVIKILLGKSLTAEEAFEEIKKSDVDIKYRQTVYRALEDLLELGIVKKEYERGSGLVYSIKTDEVRIDFNNMDVLLGEDSG